MAKAIDPYWLLIWRINRYLKLQRLHYHLLTAHREIQEMKDFLGISDDEPPEDVDRADRG